MSNPYWMPGEPYPDPMAPTGPTRWAEPSEDYAPRPDGTSTWGAPDEPASVPPPIAGPDVGYRVGWLTRSRDDAEPDGAA